LDRFGLPEGLMFTIGVLILIKIRLRRNKGNIAFKSIYEKPADLTITKQIAPHLLQLKL